ncbi:MAG: RimK/LysX family protein [Verrucomicrobiales bacterium]|nr:RimK/LysX family protein [Verrucomicrobiales bacterium]
MSSENSQLPAVGWREWVSLPSLGLPKIKAKVDTGARTSALHTFDLEMYDDKGENDRVRFKVHPIQNNTEVFIECDAKVVKLRSVRDSGGHEEFRPFIQVPIILGNHRWEIEMSLTNRDNMKFRMLLGRTALVNRFVVNSGKSYLLGHRPSSPSKSKNAS